MAVGKKIWILALIASVGCAQAIDTTDVEVHEEALDIEAGVIKTLYQVEATSGWTISDREIGVIADSLRKHLDTLPATGPIGYQEQALEIGAFGEAFEGAPTVTVTTNGAFGGPTGATNGGFGGSGGSTSFGAGPGSTYFGSPSTANTSLNQAVGIVCAEYANIRVDIASTSMCPEDNPTCAPEPNSMLSVGFGCVAAGSRPIIKWAAVGSGEILTVNVSYSDIQALSSGFQPSEAWARSRMWMAPVSGGSVVYGGPPLRRDGGLGFLVGIVEVSGGSAVFVAFVI